jgi:class 3 adenylate cyclase/predicted ATPase
MDIGNWLRSLGLERHEAAFRENEITENVLPNLTAEDLKELGVAALGHRRTLLDAIAALRGDSSAKTAPAAAPEAAEIPATTRDTAERRQVTVMFSDLVGSTALSARMDPEDLREIISAYQRCVAETVQRFGGFVAKYMGDGVLFYFGYPEAHEDDAERAVRAGLELVVAVAGLKTHAILQTRVGIATGLVVVGDLIGSGASQEQAIVGETPNLAARLQGVAEPNSVVIGESTRKLVGNLFELQDLGAQQLKGLSGPMRTWAVLRPASVESRFDALHTTGLTELVGREEELELLMRRWSKAKTGEGQVVLLSGEPGIGKSRLTAALLERLADEQLMRLRYFCSPQHTDSALYPIIRQLERAAGFQREDTIEKRLDKLEELLSKGAYDMREAAPLIADLLSIPTGGRYLALELTPQKRKEKTLAALVAQVEGLSGREPVLMVYEDVHWSDPTTRESLDVLIDRVSKLRVLVVITFRPEFNGPWVGRPQVTLLSLNRLPQRQRAEMITRVTGGKSLPKEIADQIIDRTDGVPLFIEELTKSVVESGLVTVSGDSYAVTGPAVPPAIPTTLQASLLARLDRLAPTREIAQIGAALGRSFSHELISAVAQMPRQKLDDALDQLVRAELIFRRGTPPDAEYTFKHALVQEAAYSTLLRTQRQQLHWRIAAALEGQFPDVTSTQPEIVARHYTDAGLSEPAIKWWRSAGERALSSCAYNEAITHLEKAIELSAQLDDGPANRLVRLQLQTKYGYALLHGRGQTAPQTIAAFARARHFAGLIEDVGERFSAYYGMWAASIYRGDLTSMREVSASFLNDVARSVGTPEICVAHRISGLTCWFQGDYLGARTHLEQALATYDNDRDRNLDSRFGYNPGVQAMLWLAAVLQVLGDSAQSVDLFQRALSLALQNGNIPTLATAHFTSCQFAMIARNHPLAAEHAEALIKLAREHAMPLWLARGTFGLGWARWWTGQPEGETGMREGLALLADMGVRLFEPFFGALLAEVEGKLGRVEAALKTLDRELALVEQTGERWFEAEMHRLRGELLMRIPQSDFASAQSAFSRAVEIARRQQTRMFELRAALALARLDQAAGRRETARKLLVSVLADMREGPKIPEVNEAKYLLESLDHPSGTTAAIGVRVCKKATHEIKSESRSQGGAINE